MHWLSPTQHTREELEALSVDHQRSAQKYRAKAAGSPFADIHEGWAKEHDEWAREATERAQAL